MEITPNKHSTETCKEDEPYGVPDEDAAYSQESGWTGKRQSGAAITLDIQNIQLGHEARVN